MTERPRVSVVIAAYNAAEFIERATRSVRSVASAEIIVVDDGSADDTWSLLESMKSEDPRLVPVRCPENGGPSTARNRALNIARGDWIAVLDADDEYLPGRLDVLVELGEKLHADFVFDNLVVREGPRSSSERLGRFCRGSREVTLEWVLSRDLAYQRLPVGYCKPVARRSFLERCAVRYRKDFRTGEDFLFLCEMILAGGKGVSVPEAYYVYRRDFGKGRGAHGQSMMSQASQMDVLLGAHESRMSDRAKKLLRRRHRWIVAQTAWADAGGHAAGGHLAKAIRSVLGAPLALPLALIYMIWSLVGAFERAFRKKR